MRFGAQLRRLREYYTHGEVDQRISDAETSLARSKRRARDIKMTIIEPATAAIKENSFRHIIIESLQLGHNGNGH